MHMKRAIITILLALVGAMGVFADPVESTAVSFEFGYPPNATPNTLGLNGYPFTYYMYMDIFARFELDGKISTADKAQIVHFLATYLTYDKPIGVAFADYRDGQRLVLTFILQKQGSGDAMLMTTNFDAKTLKLVAEGGDMSGTYARIYYLRDGVFVNSHALFDAAKEKALLGAKKNDAEAKNGLADMYLFDEIKDNDSRIEPLLKESLKAAKGAAARLAPLMTSAQYYLAKDDFAKADSAIAECDALLKKGGINENIVKFGDFLREQAVMMRALKAK